MELVAGLVDVFADHPLGGNPLAVVEDADDLSDSQMRKLAGEFNQAETTFILKSNKADRKLRSFTASGAEVFGAGHNALGAWIWLAGQGKLGPLDAPQIFHQEIGDDVLPITLMQVEGRVLGRMRQSPLRLLPPLADVSALAAALGLQVDDILLTPNPRPADTGTAHLLVRLRDAGIVDRAKPAADALREVLRKVGAEGCYVYAHDQIDSGKAYARFFNPTVGLWEDAATGTAAGPLAAYLGQQGLLPEGDLAVEQGTRMGRKSILNVKLTPEPELSGSGIIIFRGTIRI
ncbi:PhzF family phenazine biosynthesis protein [Cypionkella sp.]|uniref:PhzF family phenazine biosynthesis protein n=1 Tax=Cypionkella sp. TaxID=2811411 RepID=UPI002AB8993E|nr:PhzF family phenazine biosynthesis protein [Cypionkella sp.]MDZ4395140.1 PhzF family phenazine biosynthesis protein [Cypionkella sp.]